MSARERILEERYLQNDESERDMYRRVADCIEIRGNENDIFYNLMATKHFLPNTPTLRNAGMGRGGFAACYVVPIGDSLEEINAASNAMTVIHSHFGGTGFDFSAIRPEGSLIKSTGGRSCGPVPVIHGLNQWAHVFRQGGLRDGANMGAMSVHHPDIKRFILEKKDGMLEHFNLSVVIDDAFMKDLKNCESYAIELWDLIVDKAWRMGDPGILFIDNANRDVPYSKLGRMTCTNPCGEIWLYPWERCNLGSMSLPRYIEDGNFFYGDFEAEVEVGLTFLDNVIDRDTYFNADIERMTKYTRRLGLGIMGWADMLIHMGISYQSNEALNLIDKVGSSFKNAAWYASDILRNELGECGASLDGMTDDPVRNIACTCIAPTGSLSTLAGVNFGIEPVQYWHRIREIEAGTFTETSPLFEEAKKNGLLEDTANNIHWSWHIKHQAAWQKYIDNAVSKTINLPKDATREDISAAYVMAYEMGCKGITVYRDGSKARQVIRNAEVPTLPATPLPEGWKRYLAHVYETRSGCGSIRVIPTFENDSPEKLWQVFVISSGGCAANNESTGRNISLELQENIHPSKISRVLHKVKCLTAMRGNKSVGKSCADIIGTCIDLEMRDFLNTQIETSVPCCPDCGAELGFAEGCSRGTCSCGWSGCS